MPLRLKILLTYATGIALLWVGVLWLRHVYPASKFTHSPPAAAKPAAPLPKPAPMSPPQEAPSTNEGNAPQARVEAYIREWHAAWKEKAEPHLNTMLTLSMPRKDGSSPGIKDLMGLNEEWQQVILGVLKKHSSASCEQFSDLESSMGYPPSHSPEGEHITKVQEEASTATVTTTLGDESFPQFNRYELTNEGGAWRIRSINRFYSDESEVAFTEEQRSAILAKVTTDAKLPELERGVSPNCERLFTEGRKVTFLNQEHTLHIHSGGKLSVPSGVLGVRHLGAFPEEMRPLTLRIPPGEYECEYTLVYGTAVAARLILDKSSPAVSYRPAPALEAEDNDANVDHGNVAIFDAAAFMQVTKLGHEEHFQNDYVEDVLAPDKRHGEPTLIRLGNPPSEKVNCIVISTDGGCPCYWGLDAGGKPVSLVLDLLRVAEFLTDRCKLPWPPANGAPSLTHPVLEDHSVEVALGKDKDRVTFQVKGRDFSRAIWRSSTGALIADTQGMGYMDTGDKVIYTFASDALNSAAEVEVELHAGYRN